MTKGGGYDNPLQIFEVYKHEGWLIWDKIRCNGMNLRTGKTCFMQGHRYRVTGGGRVSQSRGGSPLGVYKTALGMKRKQGHVLLKQSDTGEVDEVAPLPSGLLL